MRIYGIVIVVILLVVVYYVYTIKNTFTVKTQIDNIALKNFDLGSFNSGQSFIQTKIQFTILFFASIGVRFSNLYAEAYYQNVLVAKSSNIPDNFVSINLKPNVNNVVYQTFDLQINTKAIEIVLRLKSKLDTGINYVVKGNIFGIPFRKKGIYTIKQ